MHGVMHWLPLWTLPAGHRQEGYWVMLRPLAQDEATHMLPCWTCPAGQVQEGYWVMLRPLWQEVEGVMHLLPLWI